VISTIMKFIPEIVWHAGIQITPLERLYNAVLECFDRSSGRLMVIPKLRNEAYLGAKALLHLAIQRKCIDHGPDRIIFDSITRRHQNMGSSYHGGDSDLGSTLGIIDRIFKTDDFEEMPWKKFSFTDSHQAWMGHILLCRARYILRNGEPLPDYIREFFSFPHRLDPPLPTPILSHSLSMIGLVLRIRLDGDEQQVVYERLVEF
jgi:hypothetical protein